MARKEQEEEIFDESLSGMLDPSFEALDDLEGLEEQEEFMPPVEGLDDESEGGTFYDNLAANIPEKELNSLAEKLLEEIEEDLDSREEWERSKEIGLKYLGTQVNEYRNVPFAEACGAFDTTLSAALIHFYSTARASLFPAAGPVRSQINGVPNDQTEDEGERVKMFLNYFLTEKDRGYYPDSERLLLYVGLFGCAFRKVWQDPIANEPRARLVKPQDLIINNETTDILSSSRITEVTRLTKREIILKEIDGEFIKSELPDDDDEDSDNVDSQINKIIDNQEGVSKEGYENRSLFKYYESHVELSAEDVHDDKYINSERDEEIPRPYIVTICSSTKKIVCIKRNWREEDKRFNKINYYVHYYYLPSFGIYSLGLANLLGSNQIVLTTVLRQLIDAGSLRNLPGGLRQRGMRIENNDKAVGLGEFLEVETGGAPLSECVMVMPYGEPSQVLAALRTDLKQESGSIAFTAETEIPEMGPNTPVGTTVAMMEIATRNQSSVMRSLYNSLSHELVLLKDLFAEFFGNEPYPFAVPGKESYIMKQDFNDRINIVPVADPNVLTTTHRLIIADALVSSAASAPDIHNMREVYKRRYEAMNIQNIDEILPKPDDPQALDPITENTFMKLGKPVKVALFQDHDAHLTVHMKDLQEAMMTNPPAAMQLLIHTQIHKAAKILPQLQQMQMEQGMPPIQIQDGQEEQLLSIPEIQNMIAQQDAQQVMQEQQQAMQQQLEAQQNYIDPQKVLLADIEQRREASYLKDEETKLRAETESFKAQLSHEAEMEKLETEREIAEEKNETSLEIEHLKHQSEREKNYEKTFPEQKPS